MPSCSSYSSSSQFEIFLLPIFSIGLLLPLLMMAPRFGAGLECYVENMPVGGRPGDAWLVKKFIFEIMPTANGNQKTQQCPAGLDYCLTLHCQAWGDKTIKTCVGIRPGYTPEQACAEMHKVCQQDQKFYCHTCQTDKCNNEPENRNAATANDINADNAWSFPLEWEIDEQ